MQCIDNVFKDLGVYIAFFVFQQSIERVWMSLLGSERHIDRDLEAIVQRIAIRLSDAHCCKTTLILRALTRQSIRFITTPAPTPAPTKSLSPRPCYSKLLHYYLRATWLEDIPLAFL